MTQLEECMKCPVDWAAQLGEDRWFWSLPYLDWYYSLAQKAVDGDDLPYYPHEYQEYYEDPQKLKSILINLQLRRGEAKESYETGGQRLHRIRFLTPAEHGKHFVTGMSQEQSVRRSENGPSLFWENFCSARLEGAFWGWFNMQFDMVANYADYLEFMDSESDEYKTPEARLWRRFLSEPALRICMNTIRPVGACDGAPTSFLSYDLQIDSRTAHCYPVSEFEAKRIMGGCRVLVDDGLLC